MLSARALIVTLTACALLLVGCTTSTPATPTKSSESGGDLSSSMPPSSSASAAPAAPAAPVTTVTTQPCPYLDISFVENAVGQKTPTVQVTTITPAPGPLPQCVFTRPDKTPAVTISSATAADAAAAKQQALAYAPGGNPVTAGEGGAVLVKQGQNNTLLATYRGMTVVFVSINQESSLEATEIATQVLTAVP